ncbi:MAG: 30S ribosomal protein S3 [Candidatus Gracilibacteria bacterium]|jgi:small subunit ribosomal protein S3|nr:30S ribosomal protein S3 [Candidatus Gracilibacteria bacterium]
MGQKVNPTSIRIGITQNWSSRWFARGKVFAKNIKKDLEIRNYLAKKLQEAGLIRVEIERKNELIHLDIYSSRPGIIIGRQGDSIEALKSDLKKTFNDNFDVSIKEIKKPELEAGNLADFVGRQLERRMPFRRVAKMAIQKGMEAGAKGVKVQMSGRLQGAEIARTETFSEGTVPLHTFRADISYATDTARTGFGAIGIKVWVFRGEIFKNNKRS